MLIDAGRGSTQRLFEIGQRALLTRLDAVLFTHLHSDHVVGLPDLFLTAWVFGRATPHRVFGPPGTAEMCRHLEQAYAFDRGVRAKDEGFNPAGATLAARDVAPGVVFDDDGLRVTAFRVDHGGSIDAGLRLPRRLPGPVGGVLGRHALLRAAGRARARASTSSSTK